MVQVACLHLPANLRGSAKQLLRPDSLNTRAQLGKAGLRQTNRHTKKKPQASLSAHPILYDLINWQAFMAPLPEMTFCSQPGQWQQLTCGTDLSHPLTILYHGPYALFALEKMDCLKICNSKIFHPWSHHQELEVQLPYSACSLLLGKALTAVCSLQRAQNSQPSPPYTG